MAFTKMLYLKFENGNTTMRLSPALIISDEELILVDCGTPGILPLLEEAFEREGYKLDDLTKVVITHHDHDHYGSLSELKRKYPHIKVVASEFEAPYLMGVKSSLRLQQALSIYDSLPEDRKEWARNFHAYLESIESVNVDVVVREGAFIDVAQEVSIISTPGHMPGHISVYVKGDKTLIAGDALIAQDGMLLMANPQYSLNLEEAMRSAKHLAEYDIERVICYHGGLFEGDVNRTLLAISADEK